LKETAMCKLNLRTFASMVMVAGAAVASFGAASAARAGDSSADIAYADALHNRLGHVMAYPSSREMRELRPQGTTQLWLDVDRTGKVRKAGVALSSGQRLLDRDALRSASKGRLPAMPAEAFAGEATHRFVVQVAYVADASSH
jgi:protein TonB